MRINDEGENVVRDRSASGGVVDRVPFIASPAVVSSDRKGVDFLPRTLSNVPTPNQACHLILTDPPWVSQTPCEQFFLSGRGVPIERIGRGDPVVSRSDSRVDINPEDLSEKALKVLCAVPRVASAATITHRNVQIAVGPEEDHPPVMVAVRLVDLDDFQLAKGISLVGVAGQDARG